MNKITYRRAREKTAGSDKLNCWEFMNCGREKGGVMAEILGECPVPTSFQFDGCNNGKGAGRVCWMIPNSGCRVKSGKCNSTHKCHECEFYRRVLFDREDAMEHCYSLAKTCQ